MIPAFERREYATAGMALGNVHYDACEVRVTLFRQSHAPERIVFVRIEACRDNHEFRLECIGRRYQRFLKDSAILLIALTCLHRHVDRESFTCSPSPFRLSTRSWIMRVLVRAEEEHGGIVLETMLRTVPMMYIPIHNQYTLEAVFLLHITRRNRDIVEETEAHCAPRLGMMPRRPHRTEDMLHLPAHDRIDSSQHPTGRQIRGGQ